MNNRAAKKKKRLKEQLSKDMNANNQKFFKHIRKRELARVSRMNRQ